MCYNYNEVNKMKKLSKVFVWFALILMVGSVVISIISPLLWR